MKNRKPLKETVTHYIVASGQKTKGKKRRASMKDFFEGLENRGPFVPHSLFEQFTKAVRIQMQKEGKWIQSHEDDLEFVSWYVYYLQNLLNFRVHEKEASKKTVNIPKYKPLYEFREYWAFRRIYFKIRIWGLRTKRFSLIKWRKEKSCYTAEVMPIDFRERYYKNKKTFLYVISYFDIPHVSCKDFPRGRASEGHLFLR